MKRTLISLIFVLTCRLYTWGQIDVSALDLESDIGSWYDQTFDITHSGLSVGVAPTFKYYGKENPLYDDGRWQEATIKYQGQIYKGIKAIYDLEEDFLAISHPEISDEKIKLETAALDWFSLGKDRFIRLDNISAPGYYHLLYSDHDQKLLRKLSKSLVYDQNDHVQTYPLSISYYLYTGDKLVDITRKKDLVSYFARDRKAMMKFIRTNRLVFNKLDDKANWETLIMFRTKWMTK